MRLGRSSPPPRREFWLRLIYPLDFPGSSKEPGHREISDSGLGDDGEAGGVADGESFSVKDGNKVVDFEFDFADVDVYDVLAQNSLYGATDEDAIFGGNQDWL